MLKQMLIMEGLNPSINFQKHIYSNWLAPVIFSAIALSTWAPGLG